MKLTRENLIQEIIEAQAESMSYKDLMSFFLDIQEIYYNDFSDEQLKTEAEDWGIEA